MTRKPNQTQDIFPLINKRLMFIRVSRNTYLINFRFNTSIKQQYINFTIFFPLKTILLILNILNKCNKQYFIQYEKYYR